jgi:hypothetical protein
VGVLVKQCPRPKWHVLRDLCPVRHRCLLHRDHRCLLHFCMVMAD